jgi:hypothetical protein
MFNIGDKVEFVSTPSLKGTVRNILPAVDDLPETISVDIFIPAGEPGFQFTGITENFWCGPEDLRANKGLQSDVCWLCKKPWSAHYHNRVGHEVCP